MSNNKLFIINSSGEEIDNDLERELSKSLLRSNNLNEIEQKLCCKDKYGIITDICSAHFEKDIKMCRLQFNKNSSPKNRELVSLAKNYAFDTLGMEEVIISIETDDISLSKQLLDNGFESLGEENNLLHFIIDKAN